MLYLRIINHSSIQHCLSRGRGFGVWGDEVECLPRKLSPSRVTRMIACVLLSPSSVREFGFPMESFPRSFSRGNFSHGIFLMEISVLVGSRSHSHVESSVKELLVHHHLNGSEVVRGL